MGQLKANALTSTEFRVLKDIIVSEIGQVLDSADTRQVVHLIRHIQSAHRIILYGAGRMGMVSTGFAMRLVHLGFDAHYVTEMTSPHVGPNDLLIISSGSGETKTVQSLAQIATQQAVPIALITANPNSSIGKLATTIVQLDFPNKTGTGSGSSIQPMTSLAEQSLMIFFDLITLMMMKSMGKNSEDLWKLHNNLE